MTKQDKAIEQNMLKPAGLNPKVKYSIAALLLAALLGGIWWMEQTLTSWLQRLNSFLYSLPIPAKYFKQYRRYNVTTFYFSFSE